MIIRFTRPQSRKMYVVESDTSGYLKVTDRVAVHLPEYMKTRVSVDPFENETSSDI